MEVVRRDEELEVLRKNIKNTRIQELEQELQTYHEECIRLRQMVEDMMKQGSSHPVHQQAFLDKIQQLEAQIA
jgi:chromosome segregation ATPase